MILHDHHSEGRLVARFKSDHHPLMLGLLAALLLVMSAVGATTAQAAAPAWKAIGVTGPTHMAPQTSEIQALTIDASDGSYTLTQRTAVGSGTLNVTFAFGNTTSGSNQVTSVFTFGVLAVGQTVTGPGIPEGTTITAVGADTLTLSAGATETTAFAFLSVASNEVTNASATSGSFHVGDRITGEGLPSGTTVTAVNADTLTLSAVPTAGGTPQLTATETTAPIRFDAKASGADSVQAAVLALAAFGDGSVSVVGGPGGPGGDDPYAITFGGGSFTETDVPQLTVDTTALAGSAHVQTRVPGGPGTGTMMITAANIGGKATSGAYTVKIDLPPGLSTTQTPTAPADVVQQGLDPWDCSPAGAGQSSVTCTRSAAVESGTLAPAIAMPVQIGSGAAGRSIAEISVSGGSVTSPAGYDVPITISDTPPGHGVQAMFAGAFDENGNPETRAGAHPFTAMAMFFLNTKLSSLGIVVPIEPVKEVNVELPPGFVANPMVAPRCPRDNWNCQTDAYVGNTFTEITDYGVNQGLSISPLSNVLPPKGSPAQFSLGALTTRIATTAKLRQDDYGVTSLASNLPTDLNLFSTAITLWGQPGNAAHDKRRCGGVGQGRVCPEIQGGVDKAFITNPTECTGQKLPTRIGSFSWLKPTTYNLLSDDSPPITGCENVPFEPAVGAKPTSTSPDSASGLNFDVDLPQEGLADFDKIATSHLKDVTVDLPEGVSVNPSGATGLAACSDAQMAVGSDSAPQCPDGSKLGTVQITSPLVDRPVGGTVYLGTPKSTDPTSGQMLRLFVVAHDEDLGVTIKVPGSAIADPQTGKLTATFKNNPRLPFSRLSVKLKGGDRGLLATPPVCGSVATKSTLSPWSGTVPVTLSTPLVVAGDCTNAFAPTFSAGVSTQQAAGSGALSLRFSREDGSQYFKGLTASLPPGLLADVGSVPLCSSADAAAGSCPQASRIGSVDASAGSGSPFVLEKKGDAYLTESYKGGAYGLMVKVPVEAGPFTGGLALPTQIIRQALLIDKSDAHVTAVSDDFPQIVSGIPLRIRSVTVNIDRPGFMLNPTNCNPMAISALFNSVAGASAALSSRFQVGDCASLALKPKLSIGLTGKGQSTDGKHPGVHATVSQSAGQANLKKVTVSLPLSLALDPDNAQALCEFADGSKIDPTCPKGSIVGKAVARTPILNQPLSGPVYFVKNIRKDPKSGREIRTLPKLVIPLAGENGLRLNLVGTSNVVDDHLVTTFDNIPDAPVSDFTLDITGGKSGILVVSRADICKSTQVAHQQIDGQNGKTADAAIYLQTPTCSLRVLSKKVGKTSMAIKVGGLSAGKVTVSGKGIRKTTKTISKATVATITAKRTKARLGKVTVAFDPAGPAKVRKTSK